MVLDNEEAPLSIIRPKEGAGGRKYQVVIQRPGQPKLVRMFRRLGEARLWAEQQERALRINPNQPGPSQPDVSEED